MDPLKLTLLCIGLGTFLLVGGTIAMFIIDSFETRTSEQIAADDAQHRAAKRHLRTARRAARQWQAESTGTDSDLVKSPTT